MASMSYGRAFRWHAERAPNQAAILFGTHQACRDALERRSNRLARAYQVLGVSAGDLVTIALPNGIEFFEACLAIWKLGATPSPISSRLPERERAAIVEGASPALVVGARPGEFSGRASVSKGYEPDASVSDEVLPDRISECARAMTSGGSTGRPKVILDLTSARCDPEQPENRMTTGGTTLVPGPLYHAGPFITAWQSLLCGRRIVLLERFDPRLCLELIDRHQVDDTMADREFLIDYGFSVADIIMGYSLHLANRHVPFDDLVHVSGYYDRLAARPAFQRAVE